MLLSFNIEMCHETFWVQPIIAQGHASRGIDMPLTTTWFIQCPLKRMWSWFFAWKGVFGYMYEKLPWFYCLNKAPVYTIIKGILGCAFEPKIRMQKRRDWINKREEMIRSRKRTKLKDLMRNESGISHLGLAICKE